MLKNGLAQEVIMDYEYAWEDDVVIENDLRMAELEADIQATKAFLAQASQEDDLLQ
jgi:hypothetical protein